MSCSSNVIFCPRYRALSPFAKLFDFDVVNLNFFRLCSVLVAEYLRFVHVDAQTHSFCAGLEFKSISRNFSNDVEKSNTWSANLKFVKQSSALSLSLIPFRFSCHCLRSPSNEYCNTVLNIKMTMDQPCFVPHLIGNASLSVSVSIVRCCWL